MNFIPNAVSAKLALSLLKTQKHSPTIMFAAGVVGVVGTAVLAAKATLNAQPLIIEHKKTIEEIDEYLSGSNDYSLQDSRKDKALILGQTSVKIAKLYAPAIIVGAGSIALLTGSHVVLSRRNAALTAAYAGLDKAYREYRDRVRDHVGTERETELYRNVETVKETEVGADGKKKQVTKKVVKEGKGPYSFFYGEFDNDGYKNPNFREGRPELNVMFLRLIEQQMNNRLSSRGFLFLNEVLDELGMTRTKAGQIVGWHLEKGDGYVDFGVFDKRHEEDVTRYSLGNSEGIWLDFNVDGNILELI